MDPSSDPRIAFIGAGRAGASLAASLCAAGYPVVAIASRTMASAERVAAALPQARPLAAPAAAAAGDLVFLTVPDDALPGVASEIPWRSDQSVVHCSGIAAMTALAAADERGARLGAFHPLWSFPPAEHAVARLDGATIAVEATDDALRETLIEAARRIGGHAITLAGRHRALYHAGAAIASNFLVSLAELACETWQAFGAEREAALRALLPLMQGTLANLTAVGLPAALTGPIARGDEGTVAAHLAALDRLDAEVASLYRALARRTLRIARDGGTVDADQARRLERLLAEPPSKE